MSSKMTAKRKPVNIILDLDGTIISSLSSEEEETKHKKKFQNYFWKNMENDFKVFERPGLQPFLDFLFRNFNVSVWTAASKNYGLFIIENFILIKPERKLDYYLFSHHCKVSYKKTRNQKDLSLLWSYFKLSKTFQPFNTFIIDDHPQVFLTQPSRCIPIKPFSFTSSNSHRDNELKKKIVPILKAILSNF
jgi:TFIIF-interacting CTD phosphatase-like protein